MKNWYIYTGESLLFGKDRIISAIITDNAQLEELLITARKNYKLLPSKFNVSEATYIAAVIPMLAMNELQKNQPATGFSSVKKIMRLFDGLDSEQVAINFLNGKITSSYNDTDTINRAFANGELFITLPNHSPQLLNKLPGIIVFLLGQDNAKRKAFSNYLRKGIPPILTQQDHLQIAKLRPVLASFAREIRIAKTLHKGGLPC